MQTIIDHANEQMTRYQAHPLFSFLRDESRTPAERLSFAPTVAHYILSFVDLYCHVLAEEQTDDPLQSLVNRQAQEESPHWEWYLHDLRQLGLDAPMALTKAAETLWGPSTFRSRMLTYRLCQLASGGDAIRKLTIMYCAEATSRLTVASCAEVGEAWQRETGKELIFFGARHRMAEEEHGLWEEGELRALRDLELTPERRAELSQVVDEAFALYMAFADEMLENARTKLERNAPAKDGQSTSEARA